VVVVLLRLPAPLNPSNPKPLFAALLAAIFALAAGVGFAASSPGGQEKPVRPVGSAAVPLDVPSASAEPSGLGEAAALPAMARKPKPPPKEPEPEPEPDIVPQEPIEPEPVVPEPVPAPAPPPPPPPPSPPPVEFDDEG
jgi:outer membrane biosynthesis protein TonB